jgi:hypothetical protein
LNETELERLVVRILGDTTQLNASLKGGVESVHGFTEHVERLGGVLERTFATAGIAFGAKEAFEKFEEHEKNIIRMEAVLEANGRKVRETTEEYKKFAKELNATTMASKSQVMGLLETAETYGLTGKRAEEASRNALAASKIIKDSSAESLMRFSQAIAKGDMEHAMMFTRMIPQLRGIRNEYELLAKWSQLVAAGQSVMSKEIETTGGKIEKAEQNIGAFTKQIGGVVADALQPAAEWLEKQSEAYEKLTPHTKTAAANAVAFAGGLVALNAIIPSVVTALPALAVNPLTWVIAAGAAVLIFKEDMDKARIGAKEYKAQMDELDESMRTHIGWMDQARGEEVATMKKIGDISNIEERKKALEEHRDELKSLLETAQTDFAKADSARPDMVGRALGGLRTRETEAYYQKQKESLEMYRSQLSTTTSALAAFNAQTKDLEKTKLDDMYRSFVTELNNVGRGAHEIAAIKLAESLNLSAANASTLQAEAIQRDLLLQRKQAQLDSDKQVNSMQLETKLLQEQLEFALKKVELNKEDLQIDQNKLKIAENKLKGIETKNFEAALNSNKAAKDQLELLKQAAELKDKFGDPHQRYNKEVERIMKLVGDVNALKPGTITWQEYARAIKDAQKNMLGLAAATKDATEAGSAESLSRLTDYMNMLTGFHPELGGVPAGPFRKAAAPAPAAPVQGIPGWNGGGMPPGVLNKLDEISRKLDPLQKPGVKLVEAGIGN